MEITVCGENVQVDLITIKGDGACLFNMLSMAMYGNEIKSLEVRKAIVDFVLKNYEEFRPFIIRGHYRAAVSEEDILGDQDNCLMSSQEYQDHMIKPYSYGTFVELNAAGKIFQRNIFVFEKRELNSEMCLEFHSEVIGNPQWTRIFTAFSGGRSAGHFDLLMPAASSHSLLPPCSFLSSSKSEFPPLPTVTNTTKSNTLDRKKGGRPKKNKRANTLLTPVSSEAERKRNEREGQSEEVKKKRQEKNRKRMQELRRMETEEKKKSRLEDERKRSQKTRSMETEEEKMSRLENMRKRNEQTRNMETEEEKIARLENMRKRNEQTRSMETEEEKISRLENMRKRNEQTRSMETEEEKISRLENMRKRNEEKRSIETEEEKISRLENMRKRNEEKRSIETEEEKISRLENMRKRNEQTRNMETEEEKMSRLENMRKRNEEKRSIETEEEKTKRLENKRKCAGIRRSMQTEEEKRNRLQSKLMNETEEMRQNRLTQMRERALLPWKNKENSAFCYDPRVQYEHDSTIKIGSMSKECEYCRALKWKGESKGLCCNNGKVRLESLAEPPEPLIGLLSGRNGKSSEFLQSVRSYNSAFQMTSFGAKTIFEENYMPTFKIQGQCYHLAGSLLPLPDKQHQFLQIYFMGSEELELNQRCQIFPKLCKNIVNDLQSMLHGNNSLVRSLKFAIERGSGAEDLRILIHADKKPTQEHAGRFNVPSHNEVAILIVGQEFEKRDIVLQARDDRLHRISELHRSYDALQYPLMHPYGEDGYCVDIAQYNPLTKELDPSKTVSAMNFYSYRLMVRASEGFIHFFRQLLNQYLVDMWAKIETERLSFIRNNQKKLRVENYIHLKDAIDKDANPHEIGQVVILPSSFTGGPRYMHERTQDAMTYVKKYGRPDLFITFTCNSKWLEITEELKKGQKAHDRHDIVSRVFHLKLNCLMNVFIKGKIFGQAKCYMFSVEWQKRGLPHAHILLWLDQKLSPNDIDSFISAELPDPDVDPVLYDIIIKNMIHGPCGNINPGSPCMKEGKCSKRYPRPFTRETITGDDGYPTYKRRSPQDGGLCVDRMMRQGTVSIDNRWIVPFCPLLSRTFNAHINVEFCNSVKSIKYICKYVNKGSDQAVFTVGKNKDEVELYHTGRYISTSEAVWRICAFEIHKRHPTVVHLAVHLENGQRVYFSENNINDKLQNPPATTLTAFFDLCKEDSFAQTLLYCDVPSYFTWSGKQFNRRKQGTPVPGYPSVFRSDALGRVYTVHPNNIECYHLRMLLHKIPGPTSYLILKTVNGIVHETFQAACKALGLLEDDEHWENTLKDATVSESPALIRDLFVVMLGFCQVSDPLLLWNNHRQSMTEDVLYQRQQLCPEILLDFNDEIYNEGLILVEDKLYCLTNKRLSDYGIPSPARNDVSLLDAEYIRYTSYNTAEQLNFVQNNEGILNSDQQFAYNCIVSSVEKNLGKLFFLDAAGGMGKSFLINLLLAKLRSQGKIAIAVASSGIAATLLTGGRTAHATFKLPLNLGVTETPVCCIKKNSALAHIIKNTSIIIWDECTMSHKAGIEALDRSLRDIRNSHQLLGGITVVLSGDFRQTLPVIPRGTRADEVHASIKSSFIWKHIEKLALTINMRVQLGGDQSSDFFSKQLLQIGDGKIPNHNNYIQVTSTMGIIVNSLEQLINSVFPNIKGRHELDQEWLCERAILSPKNDTATHINEVLMDMITGEEKAYHSVDSVLKDDDAVNYPLEFLNTLNPPGMPPHKLSLKVGAPIMLLRNLNAPILCNGTRLQVKSLHPNLIEASILTGCAKGQRVFIPRIPIIPSDYPFDFKRLQFPIKPCFAITINKAQGQTFKLVGVDLRELCFSHGQFYVACSRVSSRDSLIILAPTGTTKNVVYSEALL